MTRGVYFLSGLLQGLVLVLLPASSNILKAASHHGLSDRLYGTLFLASMTTSILATLGFARILASWGKRRVYFAGLLINILYCTMVAASDRMSGHATAGFMILFTAQLFLGAGFGLWLSVLNVLTIDYNVRRRDANLTALHGFLGGGAALSPFVVRIFTDAGSWPAAMLVTAGMLAVLILLAVMAGVGQAPEADSVAAEQSRPSAVPGKMPAGAAVFLWTIAAYAVAEGIFGNWTLLYLADEKGLSAQAASLALSLFWLMMTAGRLSAPFLTRFMAAEKIYRASPWVIAGALAWMLSSSGTAAAVGACVLAGLGCANFFPLSISLATARYDAWRDRLSSLAVMALMCGIGLGTFAIGWVRSAVEFPLATAFVLAFFCAAVILVTSGFLTRKSNRALIPNQTMVVVAVLFILMPALTAAAAESDPPWWPSRYGADDQRGSLNEIHSGKIVEAARLVKKGRVYDLGRVVSADIPKFPGRYWNQTLVSSSHVINERRPDYGGQGWGGNQINWITEIVSGTYQVGTQLDGLNHLQIGDRFYNGHRAADIVEEWGTNRLGVETIPPVVTRGILVDLAAASGGDRLRAGEVIHPGMVEKFLKEKKITVTRGDALLFHTGWGALWESDAAAFTAGEPGPGKAMARWIVDRGIAITGCDTWSFGAVPGEDPARPFEVPQMLNVKHGVFILENLKTEELARDQVYVFQFVVTHAKTKGSTAAQVSPAAVI